MIITGTRVRGGRYYGGTATAGDTYFNLVALLLPGNGTNGAQNNTFLDSSTNAFTVTRNGNTTQGTFSPFSQTGWSGYFNGGSDRLSNASASVMDVGTGNFTIEMWVFLTSTANQMFFEGSGNAGLQVFIESGILYGGLSGVGSAVSYTLPSGFTNTWHHIAYVREGTGSNQVSLYVDGVRQSQGTLSNSVTTTGFQISRTTAYLVYGYISNLRVVKNSAVYTGATITVPTAPLTAIANTSLLTCQSNRFIDNSTNAFAITVNGNTAVQAFAPFNPATAYAAGTVGGSAYFDGTGDYLTVANNAAFDLGSGDATIEAWIYPTSSGQTCGIFDKRSSGANYSQFPQVALVSGAFTAYVSYTGSSWAGTINGATPAVNTWTHVAFVRSGNTWTLYVNGEVSGTPFTASGSVYTSTDSLVIGASTTTGTNAFAGQISNARVVKGTAVYTSAFTPPTSPLTAVTNTQLLLNYTNAGITDAAAKNVLDTVGDAQVSTAQSKWGGSSMAFDGTGDYLQTRTSPNLDMGTGDMTVEGWFYLTTAPADYQMIVSDAFNGNNYVTIRGGGTGGQIEVNVNGTSFRFNLNNSVSANTWFHLAVTRSTNTWYGFINGTSLGNTTNSGSFNLGNVGMFVGRFGGGTAYAWPGYMDDLRITKGLARYTANFTPPTQAFPTQ